MSDDYCWRVIQRGQLHIRSWDGESIIHDERSGQTHLLSLFATALLTRMSHQNMPVATESLACMLASELALERDAAFEQALAGTLEHFIHLDLIERISERPPECIPARRSA